MALKRNDGLFNLEEYQNSTLANLADSDNDGMPDGWEIENGLDPLTDDASLDSDGDLYSNLMEYQTETDPHSSDPHSSDPDNSDPDSSDPDSSDPDSSTSQPAEPVADAGPDQQVLPGAVVTLSGLNSCVLGGTITGYSWEEIAADSVTLVNSTHPECTFVAGPDEPESLEFKLTVTDDKGIQSSDTLFINISENGQVPLADAGEIQTVGSYKTVTLDGSASSDDGTIETYLWEQTGGDAVTIISAASPTPEFSTEALAEQSLLFRLTITDNEGLRSCATTTVNILNSLTAPASNAGSDQSVDEGDTIILDGANSTAPEGGELGYLWKQISGPAVTLSDPTSLFPSCVAPAVDTMGSILMFELVVRSVNNITDADEITVQVNDFYESSTLSGVPVESCSGEILVIETGSDTAMTEIYPLDPDSISDDLNRPVEMPYGIFDFTVKCLPGETIQVYFNLPESAPSGFGWYKYNAASGWSDFSDFVEFSSDRYRVFLTLTDGGTGDADGVVNGIITDPSGLVGNSESSSSSGGCFINALF